MNAQYQVKLHPDARSDLAALDKALQRQAAKQLRKLKSHPLAGKPLGHKPLPHRPTTFPALNIVSAMLYMLDTSPTAIFSFSS